MISKNCTVCGKERFFSCPADEKRRNKIGKCRECYIKNPGTGENNPRWKGGVTFHNGYRMIRTVNHPFAKGNGYVFEHRLVMENKIGRYLKPEEQIHHINKNKLDNRIENLLVTNNREHCHEYHRKGRPKCLYCNKSSICRKLCEKHYWIYFLKLHREARNKPFVYKYAWLLLTHSY